MGKIAGKKVYLNLEATFLCGDKVYTGVASNLSPRKMIIHVRLNFPLECKDTVEVLILFNKKRVIVPVKIIKFMRTDCFCDAIEVEIITPPKEYLKFIGKRKFRSLPILSNSPEEKIVKYPGKYPSRDC
ncbi:MAG: hypothetical protein AMK70_01155 [Nitrospira bacterium SG8_35_1]|nr:MAG: hypothetical protein AMK70_01155 [Nitrospira bacterium SG8_35_1]